MIKYTLYFGTERDKKGIKVRGRLNKIKKVKQFLSKQLGGFTWIDTIGYWEGIEEKGVKLEIYTSLNPLLDENYMRFVCNFIKDILHQACILVETSHVAAEVV